MRHPHRGDQNRIGEVIKKFGADDFEERVKATEEVERFGPAAIGPLKTAETNSDPEVAYRARQALKRMEKVPHSAVAAAAVRAVVKLKPKDGAAVLIGFLPMADTEEVADDIAPRWSRWRSSTASPSRRSSRRWTTNW